MALKPDRIETQTDISFFMNNTQTRGGVVSIVSGNYQFYSNGCV
jgi:hypothetical protein